MENLSVLIFGGKTILLLPVARCLAQVPDLKLHVLSSEHSPPVRFSRHRKSFHSRQMGNDPEQQLEAVYQAVKLTDARLVLPVTDETVRLVSAQRETLTQFTAVTLTPELDVFDLVADKWLFANLLTKHDLSCPTTILCTADGVFEQRLRELPFPVLLKPRRGTAGRGILYFDNPDGLLEIVNRDPRYLQQYIVQGFIRGYDIDCSVLCREGSILAYTIQRSHKRTLQDFKPPPSIEFVEDEQTLDLVTRLVSILGWSGVAHIDLRYDEEDRRVKVIEINPRYWSSLLGSLFVGVNFPHLSCLAAQGIRFPRPDYQLRRFVWLHSVAIEQCWLKYSGKDKAGFTIGETSLRYALADPLPETIQVVDLIKRRLGSSQLL